MFLSHWKKSAAVFAALFGISGAGFPWRLRHVEIRCAERRCREYGGGFFR